MRLTKGLAAVAGFASRSPAAVASTHLSPWLSVPLAVVAGMLLAWLWWHVGRAGVPASRRWIRRASLTLALTLVPLLVAGTSFVDSTLEPRRYAEVWSVVLALLGLVVATAAIDAVNSMRLHLRDAENDRRAAAVELRSSLEGATRRPLQKAATMAGSHASAMGGLRQADESSDGNQQQPGAGA